MTPALLPLCRTHTPCIYNSCDTSRKLAADWLTGDATFSLTIQNTCSLGKGNTATPYYIPSIQSCLSGAAEQTMMTNGKTPPDTPPPPLPAPSLTRFHKVVQKLNKAEGDFSPKSIRLTSGALNTLLKILRIGKKLKIFI